MTGDDPVELGQRFDLVDDHLAHLRRALGRFLRHFENAAAQLGAGGVELAVQFGRHLLHAVHDGCELVGGLAEHAVRFARALIIDFGHRLGGLAALVLDRHAHGSELAADFGRA